MLTMFARPRSDGLEVVWDDGELVLLRAAQANELVLAPSKSQPSQSAISRIEHTYALRKVLGSDFALVPRELGRVDGRPRLSFHDPGGDCLATLMVRPCEPEQFLNLALEITLALRKVHACGLVHRDLKPAHILVDAVSGIVRLGGFGLAAYRDDHANEQIVGTLAYMAPEQTGRLRSQVDVRSDLYSLGVIFYELLQGELPFRAHAPLEWIHNHVARAPAPLSAGVPEQLRAIVMKLLAKSADDRYQTASGLHADLRQCSIDLRTTAQIAQRPLGQHDHPDRIHFVGKLYGRHTPSAELRLALERVSKGASEVILVAGDAGIGKSALINEFERQMAASPARFAGGKFDPFRRDVPYATLAEALRSLTRQLLCGSESALDSCRAALVQAVGANGKLIVDLVPELELLIGAQPEVPEVTSDQAKHRFHLLTQRVLSVFAQPANPLVLFLDDLQWVDPSMLELMRYLLSANVRHLLWIGTYRDRDVTPSHPLLVAMEQLKTAGTNVSTLQLRALSADEVVQLLAESLRVSTADAQPLARLVHGKTGGNPFFVLQFVLSLRDTQLLRFDAPTRRWQWDLPQIVARDFTDNLADFMVAKIRRLDAETHEVLKWFACFGRFVEGRTLRQLLELDEATLSERLAEAEQAGLVVRSGDGYAFPHDRVREASYALAEEHEHSQIHLRIARYLFTNETPLRDEVTFEVADHYNRGLAAVFGRAERTRVAQLNLHAARRARASIALDSAAAYLSAGIAALGEDRWHEEHQLSMALEIQRAECEYMLGALESASQCLNALAERANNLRDACTIVCLRAAVYMTQNASQEAVEACLEQLRVFGIDWPAEPTDAQVEAEYRALLGRLPHGSPEALIDRAAMPADSQWRDCMNVLLALSPAAVGVSMALHDLTMLRIANLSVEHGHCEASPLGYAQLSLVIGPRFLDFAMARRFASLGQALVERPNLRRFAGKIFVVVGYHVLPWTSRIEAAQSLIRRSLPLNLETGDLTYYSLSLVHLGQLALSCGDPLDALQGELTDWHAFVARTNFHQAMDALGGLLVLVRALRGEPPEATEDGSASREREQYDILAWWRWTRHLQWHVFAHEPEAALHAYRQTAALMPGPTTFFERSECLYYGALALAANGEREEVAAQHAVLCGLSRDNPDTFASRASLIGAELARLDGNTLEAQRGYEAAIRHARASGFVHEEALIFEHAARFCEQTGLDTSAQAFLASAVACYLRWEAHGKVRQIERRQRGSANVLTPWTVPARHLDLSSVLEMAKAVSSEIVLDRLLERLMTTAIEMGSASRGLLIVPSRDDVLWLEAEANSDRPRLEVHLIHAPINSEQAPASMLRYVVRTKQIVNLDDATQASPFASDPYFQRASVRSVLCCPLLRQGELTGVIYLENELASHAFPPERVSVLRVLASQAAISLENARLYADLQRADQHLAEAQRLTKTGSFRWHVGRHLALSDEARRICGFESGAHYKMEDVLQLAEHEDRARVEAQITLAPHGSRELISEFCITTSQGLRKHVRLEARGVESSDDSLTYVGSIMDVTVAREAEAELRRAHHHIEDARRRYERTLSSIGDGVIATDEQLRITFINPVAEQLTGWSQREALGRSLDEVFRVHSEGGLPMLVGRDERLVPIDERRTPILDDVGASGSVVVFRDVTERRRAEQAEGANQAKSEFLANVSHEIRTPMNAVLGMTELVLETSLSDEQRQWLNTVKSSADNLLTILDDLLEFSKIEAGKLVLDVHPFSVRELVHETLRALAIRTQRTGVHLHGWVDEDVPDALLGDAGRLRQVLINLIGNALKFTAKGEVAVHVSRVETNEGLSELSFLVRDTGIGIPREKQALIFEAFSQQDSSTTRKYGGTGLGLTIAARLVSMMEGTIGVQSEPGQGSTFTFTARFSRSAEVQRSLPSEQPAQLGPSRMLRVLIAEDNEFNASLARELLRRRGHQPQVSRNGSETLTMVEAGGYDVLLLDLHMPDMDGFGVIEWIRARERERGGHLHVIALTARSRKEDRERCLAAGMDDFLSKPLRTKALWRALEAVTANEEAATTSALDAETLLDVCDAEPEMLATLAEMLRTGLDERLAEAHRQCAQGDSTGLRETAHALTGMLSATSRVAAELADALEQRALEGDLTSARALLEEVERTARNVCHELQTTSVEQLLARVAQS
jgi:predicted ATPase/signal transduction histidine kinase/DNA-binding response OmpR family regulator/GAF domain-containing protein